MIARSPSRLIRRWAGAPYLWVDLAGPRRTFASDTGDVADLTGRTPAGFRSGAAAWVDGPRGKVINCPGGPDDHASFAASAADYAAFTISVRFAISPGAGGGGLLQWARDQPAYNQPFLLLNFDGSSLRTYVFGNYRLSTPIVPGDWHEHTSTFDGVNWSFYWDGSPIGSYAIPYPDYTQQQATNVYVGNAFPGSLACRFDEFRLHRRVLGPAEVARDYADPDWRLRPTRSASLVAAPPTPTFRPFFNAFDLSGGLVA